MIFLDALVVLILVVQFLMPFVAIAGVIYVSWLLLRAVSRGEKRNRE